jgi:predicted NAD-dependent protein-ADP-ribosyltransferase YbiA (DUF1768 family)
MSLELRATEQTGIDAIWSVWETQPDMELEAAFKAVNHTTFLDVVKYFRSLGLKEEVHVPKLNIMTGEGLRFTLVGDGVIQQYCKDNTLKGKPFHIMSKERRPTGAGGAPSEVDLPEYDVRVKVRHELTLARDDPRVLSAMANWHSINKSFRYMKRYSYTSTVNPNIRYDISLIRENKKDTRGSYVPAKTFTTAEISRQPIHYEVEVEMLRTQGDKAASQKTLYAGIVNVLRGIQRSYAITRKSTREYVLAQLARSTGAPPRVFPGTQPRTFHKENMEVERDPDVPNIRFEDYNVTDKADGLRALLVVTADGRIYLVDRSLNVYGTNRRVEDALTREWAGAVLDGELVTQDATGNPMSRYFAFDIYNGRGAEDVSGRPFIDRGAETPRSRLAALTEATTMLEQATRTLRSTPAHFDLHIHMKTFATADNESNPAGIFEKAGAVLDRLRSNPPYHTDGLIFTPNKESLPKNGKAWMRQLKWKPSSENSVDFLVVIERERDLSGKPTPTEIINTKVKEDTAQIVQYKTLRLFVGSSVDPAYVDPRDTVLNHKPLPQGGRGGGVYRPAEFSPQPPDPMASVCYVALNAGATDAAGAAPAAGALEARYAAEGKIFCESGDQITSGSIVEMVYHTNDAIGEGWRWQPKRVRWDKTEQFSRGQIGGTLNSEDTANDVWLSIHNPVTEDMIRTGSISEKKAEEGKETSALSYYQRKAPKRDLYKVRGLAEFHNQYIKSELLLNRVLRAPGAALVDLSVGQAGDIHKWIRGGVSWVLGCDIAESGLTDNKNGAYRRYMNELVKSPGKVPRMVFVQADSSKSYKDGSAGIGELNHGILQSLWGADITNAPAHVKDMRGHAARGFDVASLMFTLHYFFKDRASLDGLLRNLADTVKVGGFFVGCCFDGDKVIDLLKDVGMGDIKRGTENSTDLWTIKKRYEGNDLPATEECLGKTIDVNFISIGDALYTEYLVSWPYFVKRADEIGLELCNAEELAELGLQYSTNTFDVSYDMATQQRRNFPMSPALQTFSFLNRWFIFRRRSTGAGLVALAPGTAAALTLQTAINAEGPVGAFESAPNQQPPINIVLPAASSVVPPVGAVVSAAATVAAENVIEADEDLDAAAAPVAAPAAVPAAAPAGQVEAEESYPNNSAETPSPNALKVASGPIYKFYHKSAPADDFKIKNKQWRRFISTYAPFEYKDIQKPDVAYPNLEAALGAAKFQYASNLPELGPQIFSTAGNIHQGIEAKRRALNHAATEDEQAEFVKDEGDAMAEAQRIKYKKLGSTAAKFNEEAWTNARERVLTEYVRQRYERDSEFRKILDAVKAKDARLVFSPLGSGNELSGKVDGETISGENLYGRALMRAVGLTY